MIGFLYKRIKFLILLTIIPVLVSAQQHPLWGSLEQGSYGVGFKIISKTDYSRTFRQPGRKLSSDTITEHGRPINIYIWYPSKKTKDSTFIPFSEYLELEGIIGKSINPNENTRKAGREEFINYFLEQGSTLDRLQLLLNSRTACEINTTPEKGPFPLILFAPGIGEAPVVHSIICEYLASHGYVVVQTPSIGMFSREMHFSAICNEAQTRDLEFALSQVCEESYVDSKKIGVIGFSLGSVSALLLGMRNADVCAVVSLDGSIGFKDRISLVKQSPFYDPDVFTVPLLHMNIFGNQRNDLGIIDSLKASHRIIISFKDIQHPNFTSMGLITGLIPGIWKIADRNARAAYETIARYALNFCNGYIKNEQPGLKFLTNKPADNDVQKDLIQIISIEEKSQVH